MARRLVIVGLLLAVLDVAVLLTALWTWAVFGMSSNVASAWWVTMLLVGAAASVLCFGAAELVDWWDSLDKPQEEKPL